MTKSDPKDGPTQAQIEALQFYADRKTWEWHHDWEHHCLALQDVGRKAAAALTAAAKAWEIEKAQQAGYAARDYLYGLTAAAEAGELKEVITFRELEIEKNMEWNRAIERCAQVAIEIANDMSIRAQDKPMKIIAAIMAMKD